METNVNAAIEPTVRKIETFIEGFYWVLPNFGIALVVFLLVLIAASVARRAVREIFRRRDRDNLGELLAGSARWALIVFGVLVVATIVFPSIKPADLLATLGIGSVAIGFAFKDILQNWLSGLLILYRQPFRRGDQIVSGSYEGTVESGEARATLIRTYDGQRVVHAARQEPEQGRERRGFTVVSTATTQPSRTAPARIQRALAWYRRP